MPVGILDGKKILITGVLTDTSIAFGVARVAQEEGAEIILTGAGRGLSIIARTAKKVPTLREVLELDRRVKIAVKRSVEQIGDALTVGQLLRFGGAQRIGRRQRGRFGRPL